MVMYRSSPEPTSFAQYGELAISAVNAGGGRILAGAAMLEKLSAMQMEGIVSKNVEAPYRSGRNESWLKIKCVQRAKFPIVGFVKDPAGLAALHLAKREWKDFVYVGKSRHGLQSKIINGNPQEA